MGSTYSLRGTLLWKFREDERAGFEDCNWMPFTRNQAMSPYLRKKYTLSPITVWPWFISPRRIISGIFSRSTKHTSISSAASSVSPVWKIYHVKIVLLARPWRTAAIHPYGKKTHIRALTRVDNGPWLYHRQWTSLNFLLYLSFRVLKLAIFSFV